VKFNAFQMVYHTFFMVCGVTTREKFNNFWILGRLLLIGYFVARGCHFTSLHFPIYKLQYAF
jgi:hypothetical protein